MAILDIFKKKKSEKKKTRPPKKSVQVKPAKMPVPKKAVPDKPVQPAQKPKVRKVKGEAYRILKGPHVTEKASYLTGKNQYVFKVWPRANKTEVRQILWNLMLNAVQAMPERGVLKVEARPARVGEIDGAEISIGDTGCGIGEGDFSKIYDPFYTTRDTGTGLGLPVVKRILEAYGGKIHMKSEPGEGSVFTIWLPVHAAAAVVAGS